MQNRELIFTWGKHVKSFLCFQHVLSFESVSAWGASFHGQCFRQVSKIIRDSRKSVALSLHRKKKHTLLKSWLTSVPCLQQWQSWQVQNVNAKQAWRDAAPRSPPGSPLADWSERWLCNPLTGCHFWWSQLWESVQLGWSLSDALVLIQNSGGRTVKSTMYLLWGMRNTCKCKLMGTHGAAEKRHHRHHFRQRGSRNREFVTCCRSHTERGAELLGAELTLLVLCFSHKMIFSEWCILGSCQRTRR